MTFKYRVPRSYRTPARTGGVAPAVEREVLTGEFQGQKASDDEERFLTRFQRYCQTLYFRFILGVKYMPGWLELDFLAVMRDNRIRAGEIDDLTFVHKGQREKSEAKIKDIKRMQYLSELGIVPYKGIEHIDAARLQTPEQSDRTVREFARS